MNKKTCLICTTLNTCRLKDFILNKKIKTCNYAKEGCVHYRGVGFVHLTNKVSKPKGSDKDRILCLLQHHKNISMATISAQTGLPISNMPQKQIIWNAVNRLIKEGYKIEKFGKNEAKSYKLISDIKYKNIK